MRLPNYDTCSLQELHMFLAERHIQFKFTRAQAHTKTLYKRDKQERRALTAALEKADAAANIRFMELPLELRDEIYEYFLTDITTPETLTKADLRERMWQVSPQFCVEVGNVFNRGEYETLPELIEEPTGPFIPAQEIRGIYGRSHSLSLHLSAFQNSTTRSMDQGRFSLAPSSYGITRQESMMSRLGYAGLAKDLLHQDHEPDLMNYFDKLHVVVLQNDVYDVLRSIPAPKPRQQTPKQYMEHNAPEALLVDELDDLLDCMKLDGF